MPEPSKKLRLNQAIAMTGLCSRRKADGLIAAGKVQLNGQVCKDFNTAVDPDSDSLTVNGQEHSFKQFTYVALHKPSGVVTTTIDEKQRKKVTDLLPAHLQHLKPVGRLDMYSEGLLILTNDGDLALKLTHPRHHLAKEYLVKVKAKLGQKQLQQLRDGIPLADGITLPAKVEIVRSSKDLTELKIHIYEGKNRQLRRMFEYLGHRVDRLVRLAVGALQLGEMPAGSWRFLTSQEVSQLHLQSTD